MLEGVCYSVNSDTQIYVFPELSCSEGEPVPATNNAVREVWNLNQLTNEYVKYQTGIASVNTGTATTKTIAHLWSEPAWFDMVSPSFFLLPATIVVCCLFKLIINIYMGVRR